MEHGTKAHHLYSKALQEAKRRYLSLEKRALAVVLAARRLHMYFQAHPIHISNNYLLLQMLHKLSFSGRIAKWTIELSKYDIKFILATIIKA